MDKAYQGASSILVFTKNPKAAAAKTRLRASSELPNELIDELAAAFVIDTLTSVQLLNSSPLFIASEPISTAADWQALAKSHNLSLAEGFLDGAIFLRQRGSNFTSRLQNAIRDTSRAIPGGLIILGSDAPLISPKDIAHALVSVEQGRVVLGPSLGGGIYLIGIPTQGLDIVTEKLEGVFEGEYQSELEALSAVCASSKLPLEILKSGIDVDTEEDLGSVIAILKADEHSSLSQFTATAKYTRQVVKKHDLALSRCEGNNRLPKVVSLANK
jgi:glycosyltransferase A (GT-A) superfamily protein (DUF2064 family)